MSKIFKRIHKFISDPYARFFCWDSLGMYRNKSDAEYLKKKFKLRVGYELDLENPKSFNEKIQWLKINDHNPDYISLVDKVKVKDFVADRIGSDYVIPTIGVWDKVNAIDFDALPEKFVIKCNHNSGIGLCVCKNKKDIDIARVKNKLEKGLQEDYFIHGREWPYKNVERKIIAEELLENEDGTEVLDYKFMVFNGKVRCSFTCTERFSEDGLKVTFFDENWNVMPFERHYPKSKKKINKPQNYDLMVELAEKLAEGIRFVRVDFYEVNNKVYFGEMTFYPGSGMEEFTPVEWDYKLGDWICL